MSETTVDSLNDLWNALRNAIMGRGTKPIVPSLANRVTRELKAWKQFQSSADRLVDDLRVAELNTWVDRYNALEKAYAQQAGQAPAPVAKAKSFPRKLAEAASEAVDPLAKSILAAGVGVGLLLIALNRRGR